MRVIAGRLGGRKLEAPQGEATRPTSDRVREALFSILGNLQNAQVLDLYAGTGALGIEALSRGAERAVFVENAKAPLAMLRKNVTTLALGGAAVILANDVDRSASRLLELGPFDCVFADPPYAITQSALATIGKLSERGMFPETAMIVLEHATKEEPNDQHLTRVDRRAYGGTSLSFYRPVAST